METIRIKSNICNALLDFEIHETRLGTEYATLHGVQLEPTVNSTLTIPVDLSDEAVNLYYKNLLNTNINCDVFDTLKQAEAWERTWHEAYEVTA